MIAHWCYDNLNHYYLSLNGELCQSARRVATSHIFLPNKRTPVWSFWSDIISVVSGWKTTIDEEAFISQTFPRYLLSSHPDVLTHGRALVHPSHSIQILSDAMRTRAYVRDRSRLFDSIWPRYARAHQEQQEHTHTRVNGSRQRTTEVKHHVHLFI